MYLERDTCILTTLIKIFLEKKVVYTHKNGGVRASLKKPTLW